MRRRRARRHRGDHRSERSRRRSRIRVESGGATRFRREFTDWRRWPRISTRTARFGRSQAAARGRGRRPPSPGSGWGRLPASPTSATTASGWPRCWHLANRARCRSGSGAAMAVAAAVTVATVVRRLHARRDEIEIMSFVGAPLAFIRGPFVAEGCCRVVSGRSLRCCCWGPHSPSPSPGGERTFRRF